MNVLIDIASVVCCLAIFVQDVRTRMISVVLFLLAGLLFVTDLMLNKNENFVLLSANYLFVLGQIGFLYFYFVRIRKTGLSFFDGIIGWGDVMMLLCTALVFPLPQFILYLLLSYVLGMVFSFSGRIRNTENTIPLAGIMALVYALNVLVHYCASIYLIQPFSA